MMTVQVWRNDLLDGRTQIFGILVMLAVPRTCTTARLDCCYTWDPAASCSPFAWDVSKKFL